MNKTLEYFNDMTKQLKAFSIIKEKNVDVALLKHCDYYTEYNLEIAEHNDTLKTHQDWWHRKELAEEEFDFLKEMLKDDN